MTANFFPTIVVTPSTVAIDEAVHLHIVGLQAGEEITIVAEQHDDEGARWQSRAKFRAGATGVVDLSTQAPLSGSYHGVDSMGLFWSMATLSTEPNGILFSKSTIASLTTTLQVQRGEQQIAVTSIQRHSLAQDVTHMAVRADGIVGTFFVPTGGSQYPGVLVFGGSGGSLSETQAALLAAHGYATLALAYFAYEDLPPSLLDIPLEYFEAALAWLQAQPTVHAEQLAVMGASRGGELALLLGATFPQIKVVVAYVPSNVVWEGFGKGVPSGAPAWSYRGASLPVIEENLATELIEAVVKRKPIATTPLYFPALADAAAVARATIPVEQSHAALLLISGEDDQMWPSTIMADLVMARLEKYNYPNPYLHLSYPAAGHQIGIPHLPTSATAGRHKLTGEMYAYGGTAKGNAFASADSWRQLLYFLAQHLQSF